MMKITKSAKYVGEDLIYMDNYSRINFYKYLKNLSPKGTIVSESTEDDEENNFKYSDVEDPDLDEFDYWKNYRKNKLEDPDLDEMD